MLRTLLIALAIAEPALFQSVAALIELRPVADTSLHQIAQGSNMGGHSHVAVGTTAQGTRSRGLFRFDLSAVPANAVITSVTITFDLPQLPRADLTGNSHSIHRVLTAWGEGTKTGNLGLPATAGEASWLHSAHPATWQTPGGDFAAQPSGTQVLGPSPGVFTMNSTPDLIADVQAWLADPSQNFGWLLKATDETPALTARRFSSRETPEGARLRIEYSEALPELRFTSIDRLGESVLIRWSGGRASAALERTTAIDGEWAAISPATSGEFTDTIARERAFYRLVEE
jgi:hypothetical protein